MPSPKPVATHGTCGCTGVHPPAPLFPVLASPTESGGMGRNTRRMDLIPIACCKLNDSGFNFGSSFVVAATKPDFDALANLAKQYPGAPFTIFGHADPVGDDSSNKTLSGHRAQSIYAILIRDSARWESLYQSGGSEGWGQGALEHILTALGFSLSAGYSAAVKQFQQQAGLSPVDGIAGSQTRAKLFAAYMDFLCPTAWKPSDFLARGADSSGKGDFQGCGEFNPYLVFSQSEEQAFAQPENQAARNTENAVNRRVVIYLFRPGTTVSPDKWPCPRSTEGTSGCTRRLWSNGQTRRSPAAARREFGDTQDTFACRFYHRLALESPCEGVEPKLVELIIPLEEDIDGDPETPDRIRLIQQDGAYTAELTVGDPDVVKDGENPLYYYHFHAVPPGKYAVEVFAHKHWHAILAGLQVSVQGAFYSGKSFEADTDGDQMGTPHEFLADELPPDHSLDLGCC